MTRKEIIDVAYPGFWEWFITRKSDKALLNPKNQLVCQFLQLESTSAINEIDKVAPVLIALQIGAFLEAQKGKT